MSASGRPSDDASVFSPQIQADGAARSSALAALGALPRATEADKGVLADLHFAGPVLANDAASRSARSTACCPPTPRSATSSFPTATARGSRSTRSGSSGTGSRLFSRRLEVDQLTIGHMQFLRRPLAPGTAAAGQRRPQSILPELPLKVIIKQFGVQELVARRAGRRRRGAPRDRRQGDARAAVRGPRP